MNTIRDVAERRGGGGGDRGRPGLTCVARHDTLLAMARSVNGSTDLGRFIRQQVIPPGMTVTEAARKLGVGRPALSNLLNGRAALSQNMALRLEETFGADRTRLFDLQAGSDRETPKRRGPRGGRGHLRAKLPHPSRRDRSINGRRGTSERATGCRSCCAD